MFFSNTKPLASMFVQEIELYLEELRFSYILLLFTIPKFYFLAQGQEY